MSAATLPESELCPLTQRNMVIVPDLSRASINVRTALIMSWFITESPPRVRQPLLAQLLYHTLTQLIEYVLSEKMRTGCVTGTDWSARRIAVNSARWFVCRVPLRRSEMFLYDWRSA